MQGSEFIDMMKKVLGVTTNKELASFFGNHRRAYQQAV